MSWLFAITSSTEIARISKVHDEPLLTICVPHFYLAVGGIPETCLYQSVENGSSGWAVVGHGIELSENRARILATSDWNTLLCRPLFDARGLDGSFVILRWQPQMIECFTDQLGLRTLYFSQSSEDVCLSTRPDWVAKASGYHGLDMAALGARWFLFNQLDYNSCIREIDRLGPGGRLRFESAKVVQCRMTPWTPEFSGSGSTETVSEILRSSVSICSASSLTPSLGLSGGIDSRLLLASMSAHRQHDFVTHSFGEENDPDVHIARRIALSVGIPHKQLSAPLPDTAHCVRAIRAFAARMMLAEPVSSWLKLRYYPGLREQGKFLIDGGFGEIARHQYLKRFARFGTAALRSANLPKLLNLMRCERSNLLSAEVQSAMERGALESLRHAVDEMPAVETIGMKNYADLFALRTRVPNYGSPEQARIDEQILNIMPLVQPSFLRAVFDLPVKARTDGAYYLAAIRRLAPQLCRYPMVKSGCTYPFGISSNMTWLLTKVKSKLRMHYADSGPSRLLHHLREYVLDTAHSRSVLSDSIYDPKKVVDVVDRYYKGEERLRSSMDWWLTFELWKSSFET